MKKHLLIIAFTFIGFAVNAQGNLAWAKRLGGGGDDHGNSVAVDGSGNVYTTGYFNGTVDFDPGAGTFTLTAVTNSDIYVSKLSSTGAFIWAKQLGGKLADVANDIEVDGSGNVYTTGFYNYTADFDPGVPVYNLISAGSTDIFVSKLDASGNFVWAKSMGGTQADVAKSITLDANNVYTTGSYSGTADFDPSAATSNLLAGGVFVSKLNALGNFVWAKKLGGLCAYAIAVDGTGNVHTAGSFSVTGDFDPGAPTYTLAPVGGADNVFVSKLDNTGAFVWAKQFGGSNANEAYGIALDGSGNVYTTGNFVGTTDFDPSGAVVNLASAGATDIFISKLSSAGAYVWAKQIGGTSVDLAAGITIDATGVYTTGYFVGTVDFNPGAGSNTLVAPGASEDAFVSKLDLAGVYLWADRFGGNTSDDGNALAVNAAGNVYLTGFFNGTGDYDPGAGTVNLVSSGGSYDAFVVKLCQNAPAVPASITGITTMCAGTVSTYSIATVIDATSYGWTLPGAWTGASTTNTISATAANSGTISVVSTNACGSSATQTLAVTVNSLPVISMGAPNYTVCMGSSVGLSVSGATSYTWNTGAGLSCTVCANPTSTPTTSTIYTVTGTDINGCVNNATATVTTIALPIITVNSGAICFGGSYTLSPGGASTYTFSSGPIVTPTATSSYSVTGTSAAGCVSATPAVSSVTVNPLPVITVNSATICVGQQTAILTATGGSTYSWSPSTGLSSNNGSPVSATPVTTQPYTVVATDANGCVGSNTTMVTVDSLPNMCIGTNNPVCQNQTINLNYCGSSSGTYSWVGPNAFTSTAATITIPNATPVAAGTYTLTLTDGNGCVNATSAIITINPLPVLAANANTPSICVGDSDTLNVNGANTYTWSTNAGSVTTVSVAVTPSVTANYTVTGTDLNGCIDSTTVSITVNTCGAGIKQNNSVGELKIYPNPVKGQLFVELADYQNAMLEILSLDGKIIQNTSLTTEKTGLSVSDLANGVYFLKIKNAGGVSVQKFVKD